MMVKSKNCQCAYAPSISLSLLALLNQCYEMFSFTYCIYSSDSQIHAYTSVCSNAGSKNTEMSW